MWTGPAAGMIGGWTSSTHFRTRDRFVMLVAVALQTSFLTPPVGFALFYLKGVCPPEVGLVDIYRGVAPFIVIQLIGLTIIALFPALVIWLPAVAYN